MKNPTPEAMICRNINGRPQCWGESCSVGSSAGEQLGWDWMGQNYRARIINWRFGLNTFWNAIHVAPKVDR